MARPSEHHYPYTSTTLCCLVTEGGVREQLDQGRSRQLSGHCQCRCQRKDSIAHHLWTSPMHQYRANKNVFSRRLKAASVEFGLRTWSRRLFQADGPAMAKTRRRLRSSTSHRLEVLPIRRFTVCKRAITVFGATVWNDLPLHVASAPSLAVFRQRLNTFLFSRSYQDTIICLVCYYHHSSLLSGHLWSLQ